MRIAILIIALVYCSTVTSAQQTLKILTYNLTDGVADKKEDVLKLQTWMKSKGTDVAAFQNLTGTDATALKKMAKKWKHKYNALIELNNKTLGITSKYPIQSIPTASNNFLSVQIEGITYVVVAIETDSSTTSQKEQADKLSATLSPLISNNSKVVLLGTIQGYAPLDSSFYTKRFRQIPANARTDKKIIQQLAGYQRSNNYELVRTFTNLGLMDILGALRSKDDSFTHTYPSKVFGEMPSYNAYRYDYIFITPTLKSNSKAATILQDEITHYLSEHYPVLLELAL